MFLVLTRNPRRVEHFSYLARRIPTVRFPYIEERSERKKKKTKTLGLSISSPSLSFVLFFILFYFILKWDPHVQFSFTSWSFLAPKQIIFRDFSISFIIIQYSLNIFHFSRFF